MASKRDFSGLESLLGVERPAAGWLRTVRKARGLSAGELGRRLGVSRQLPLQFERAEVADTITLKSLRAVAAALDCELVYALVPRKDKLRLHMRDRRSEASFPEKPLEKARHEQEPLSTPADKDADLHFCD